MRVKKIVLLNVLVGLLTISFSYSLFVFPENKASGAYLYCLSDTHDADIASANVFITGKDLFFTLDAFVAGSKVIAGAYIPSKEIIDFLEYDIHCYIQTPGGSEYFSEKLLGIKGLLLPLYPPTIPFEYRVIANHQVLQGEYLYQLASEYEVERADLEILNEDATNGLHAGDQLIIGSVVFQESPYVIEVSLEKCQLTLHYDGQSLLTFPVAVGRGVSTPSGIYTIKRKVEDPALYWEGEYIQPLSPINGLGKWWLELSNPQYGIHGTNKPWEIGKRISHGCIRMFNEDVTLLQSLVPIGTRVVIR